MCYRIIPLALYSTLVFATKPTDRTPDTECQRTLAEKSWSMGLSDLIAATPVDPLRQRVLQARALGISTLPQGTLGYLLGTAKIFLELEKHNANTIEAKVKSWAPTATEIRLWSRYMVGSHKSSGIEALLQENWEANVVTHGLLKQMDHSDAKFIQLDFEAIVAGGNTQRKAYKNLSTVPLRDRMPGDDYHLVAELLKRLADHFTDPEFIDLSKAYRKTFWGAGSSEQPSQETLSKTNSSYAKMLDHIILGIATSKWEADFLEMYWRNTGDKSRPRLPPNYVRPPLESER